MTKTEDGTKTGSAARADSGDDTSFVSKDTFANPSVKLLANTATVTDGYGIERIVSVGDNDFTPAPLEATDEQKKAMADFDKTLTDARDKRTALLGGSASSAEEGAKNAAKLSDVPNEERAPNSPGVGGSQEGPDPKTVEGNSSSQKKG